MKAEYLIDTYADMETAQDLFELLKLMSPKTRRSSYIRICVNDEIHELESIQLSQSDQMESHELKVCIRGKK